VTPDDIERVEPIMALVAILASFIVSTGTAYGADIGQGLVVAQQGLADAVPALLRHVAEALSASGDQVQDGESSGALEHCGQEARQQLLQAPLP
jgi:hypothetical protein